MRSSREPCFRAATSWASGLTMQEPLTFDEPVLLSSPRAVGACQRPQSYRYSRIEDLRQATEASPFTSAAVRWLLTWVFVVERATGIELAL